MHFSSKHRMLLRSMKHTQLCNTPSSPAQLVTKYWGTGEDIVFNWHWKQGWAELLLRPPSAVFHTHRGSADFDVLNAGGPFWHTLTVWSWKAKLLIAQILKGPFTPTTPLGASVCLKEARKSPQKEPNLLWLHPWPEAWGPAVRPIGPMDFHITSGVRTLRPWKVRQLRDVLLYKRVYSFIIALIEHIYTPEIFNIAPENTAFPKGK